MGKEQGRWHWVHWKGFESGTEGAPDLTPAWPSGQYNVTVLYIVLYISYIYFIYELYCCPQSMKIVSDLLLFPQKEILVDVENRNSTPFEAPLNSMWIGFNPVQNVDNSIPPLVDLMKISFQHSHLIKS